MKKMTFVLILFISFFNQGAFAQVHDIEDWDTTLFFEFPSPVEYCLSSNYNDLVGNLGKPETTALDNKIKGALKVTWANGLIATYKQDSGHVLSMEASGTWMTARGIRAGDPVEKVFKLYGQAEITNGQIVYEPDLKKRPFPASEAWGKHLMFIIKEGKVQRFRTSWYID